MKRRLAIPAPHRRGFLTGVAGLLGATSLTGCDRFAGTADGRRTLKVGEDANFYVQRLLLTPASLARTYPESEISRWFKPNGTVDPEDKPYKALAARNFETYRLRIDGLVDRPQEFSLTDLRALPARTQITRHDCVEGWSAIGKWTGVPLSELLQKVGLKAQARYIVFHCADTMEYAMSGDSDDTSDDPADAASGSTDSASDQKGDGGGQTSSNALAWGGTGSSDNSADRNKGEGSPSSGGAMAWGGSGSDTGTPSDPKTAASKPTDPKAAAAKPADPKKTGNPDMQARPAGQENQASDSSGGDTSAQGGTPIRYYESIDLVDAYHPQTLLAYEMNGKPLPVSNGAPLRLRVERQLGYKQAKYIMRIEVAESLDKFGDGKGGYWEDRGYEWYAGI